MLVCIYDTETTDLPADWASNPSRNPSDWPHLMQLAWVLVDTATMQLICKWSNLVQLRPGVHVNPGARAIHGISRTATFEHGVEPSAARIALAQAILQADLAVCHNVDFDRRIMIAEAARSNDNKLRIALLKPHFCTMHAGVSLCKIPRKKGFKWPSLTELHLRLFNEGFDNAHDALTDVMACKRCFLWMLDRGLVAVKS